jgi:hypothetical protein
MRGTTHTVAPVLDLVPVATSRFWFFGFHFSGLLLITDTCNSTCSHYLPFATFRAALEEFFSFLFFPIFFSPRVDSFGTVRIVTAFSLGEDVEIWALSHT